MPRKIEISHRTIIFTVVFLIALWFLYFIKDILFALFVSLLLMFILNPLVTKMTKIKIPRVLAVVLSYLLVFGLFGFAVSWVVPPLVEQTTNFVNNIPVFIKDLGWQDLLDSKIWENFSSDIGKIPGQAVKFGVSFFSNVVGVISVFILTFYFLLYRERLDMQIPSIFGETNKNKIGKFVDELELKIGGWTRGQMILMLSVGVLVYLGLILLGIPFALPLAIIAGLFEVIPVIGPNISAIIAIVIALTISPIMALAVGALYILIQQVENYFLVPKIMQKSAGVNPIITLIALAVGFRLAGVVGALFSVPIFLTLQILFKQQFKGK